MDRWSVTGLCAVFSRKEDRLACLANPSRRMCARAVPGVPSRAGGLTKSRARTGMGVLSPEGDGSWMSCLASSYRSINLPPPADRSCIIGDQAPFWIWRQRFCCRGRAHNCLSLPCSGGTGYVLRCAVSLKLKGKPVNCDGHFRLCFGIDTAPEEMAWKRDCWLAGVQRQNF
jgi:hypothetical protein